eukprot:2774154-Pleurochrysis_carterae.AAC.1
MWSVQLVIFPQVAPVRTQQKEEQDNCDSLQKRCMSSRCKNSGVHPQTVHEALIQKVEHGPRHLHLDLDMFGRTPPACVKAEYRKDCLHLSFGAEKQLLERYCSAERSTVK